VVCELSGNHEGILTVTTGIGQAISQGIAGTGANVALLDLDVERQADTVRLCEAAGVKAIAYACNVTKYEVCKEVFAKIERDLGPIR
jgi:NAD(P)-dependent dehydrogenase (short-subunit alcohol dehydrogenase family)